MSSRVTINSQRGSENVILVVTEKNDAAQQIARLLSESGKPKADKVYDTPV